MTRYAFLFAFAMLACAMRVDAAPLDVRQTQCDSARAQALASLTSTSDALKNIAPASGSNPLTPFSKAQAGLQNAQMGLQNLAGSRAQVEQGLQSAEAALKDMALGDPTATNIPDIQSKLRETMSAGQGAIAACGLLGTPPNNVAGPSVPGHRSLRRQLGNSQCNTARLRTASSLAATTKSINKLATAAAGDNAVAGAVQNAQTGLTNAQGGIKTINGALLTGQSPPTDAHGQVQNGLVAAKTALTGIASTDPGVTSAVADAQANLDKMMMAGAQVMSNCAASGTAAAGAGGGIPGAPNGGAAGGGVASGGAASGAPGKLTGALGQ